MINRDTKQKDLPVGLMFGLAVALLNAPLTVVACPVSATDTASHHHAGGVPVAAQRKQVVNIR
ncbi:TPA: hypothetical protein ACGP9Y_002301 [Escherichia coli]